jgi:hypothetical protein
VLSIEGRVLAHVWGRVYLVLALDSWMSTDFVEIFPSSDWGILIRLFGLGITSLLRFAWIRHEILGRWLGTTSQRVEASNDKEIGAQAVALGSVLAGNDIRCQLGGVG